MNMFLIIFSIFFKLGFFSFGGGYVMIPMIERELLSKGIQLLPLDIANITAIAGMAPGPVAVNAAVGFGYKIHGILGVFAAFLGVALPCAIIVIVVVTFFFKLYEKKVVQWALYGLRPVITGIIVYAAINMGIKNKVFFDYKSILITAITFVLLAKTRIHPIIIIISSGVIGILFLK